MWRVDHFRYLGGILTEDGTSDVDVKTRLGIATTRLEGLKTLWKCRSVTLKTKIRLLHAIITATVLYACQSWTLSQASMNRIQAFEMRCLQKLMNISFTEHRTNDSILRSVSGMIGPFPRLLTRVKRLKLKWFGHVSRHDCYSRVFLQGRLPGSRPRGRPRRNWCDDIRKWTDLSCITLSAMAYDRDSFRRMTYQCT